MLRQTVLQTTKTVASRSYATAAATASAPIVPKPTRRVGAFRGGFLGFFVGVSLTSLVTYSYVLDQHKSSSNVIISDVLSLQKSIRTLEEHVRALERQQKVVTTTEK
ncbi:unnamed protein product [Wickerhamomyces anomalus]